MGALVCGVSHVYTCCHNLYSFLTKPQKKEDQQLDLKTSPKKVSESTVDLLGLGK